jgi:hypothetical protein
MAEQYKFPDELEDGKNQKVVIEQPEDDVEIEIVDDTPAQDRGRRPLDREVEDPTDEEIESYTRGAQDRIKELTHARHDERRAKEALLREKQELERLAQHYVDENKKLKQYVNNGTEQYGAMAKTAAEAEMEKARREYKAAQESFDTDAILAAQEALFDAKSKLQQAQNFRPPPLQVEESAVQPRQQQTESVKPDEKTLRWQAKNQWFGSDGFEEVTSFALGLHQKLVNSGVDPRHDEYFEQIDARVKSKFPEVFGGNDDRPSRSVDTSSRKPAAVVAPATRSTGTRKVQLTPSQAALIKKYNLDPKKYVAEVLKLENQNG